MFFYTHSCSLYSNLRLGLMQDTHRKRPRRSARSFVSCNITPRLVYGIQPHAYYGRFINIGSRSHAVVHVCNGCATLMRHSVKLVHVALASTHARVDGGSVAVGQSNCRDHLAEEVRLTLRDSSCCLVWKARPVIHIYTGCFTVLNACCHWRPRQSTRGLVTCKTSTGMATLRCS